MIRTVKLIDMRQENPLGDYLRGLREVIQPSRLGLALHGNRRVAELRCEEVATPACLSMGPKDIASFALIHG